MASSLVKVVSSNLMTPKSVILFRPVAAASSRLLSTFPLQNDFDPFDEDCNQNLNGNFCNEDIRRVRKVLDDAYCPRLLATRNLARLLNLMDERSYVEITPRGASRCLRWDVMEDTNALYIVRDMSGISKKTVVEQFDQGPGSIFDNVRIIRQSFESIRIIVGREDPNPGFKKPGYLIELYLPHSVFKYSNRTTIISMDVKNDVLKVTIPKKKKEMIRSITTQLKFYD